MGSKNQEEGEEDDRIEAAIAATAPSSSRFKPKHVSQEQLSKLQELHKRRLEIKAKMNKKFKGGSGKYRGKDISDGGDDGGAKCENSGAPDHKDSKSSLHQDELNELLAPKKRQKLHWGYFNVSAFGEFHDKSLSSLPFSSADTSQSRC
ncbi:hypothetical protein Tsubulata_046607, partial [Turnera subulata]